MMLLVPGCQATAAISSIAAALAPSRKALVLGEAGRRGTQLASLSFHDIQDGCTSSLVQKSRAIGVSSRRASSSMPAVSGCRAAAMPLVNRAARSSS
jgi:hypothetical protein